jgi:1-acyl-sn-glycerol-3-phosphate acyltransferase
VVPEAAASPAEVAAQIRALEARLDHLIKRATLPAENDEPPPSISAQVTSRARDVVERLASVVPPPGTAPDAANLFTNPYYIRTWGPRSLEGREEVVDEFGFDPAFYARVRPLLEFVYRRYFRVETRGIERVPSEGPVVIVTNHSGTVPLDGAMLRVALNLDHPGNRELRWLAEDFVYYLPFVGVWFNRVGAVRACHENAERLLRTESVLAVFPEGTRGIKKLYRDRYRLERFGRGGFVRLCLRTRTPMIPCAIIGAEETNPMLRRVDGAARALGLPYLPVTPTFPWLGPLGLLPAPTKWTIQFAEPIRVDDYGPEAADDHVLVGRLSVRVQASIDEMLRDGLSRRKSVWFG